MIWVRDEQKRVPFLAKRSAPVFQGKCQTENAILNAKLTSRDQQFEVKYKELNNQYLLMKRKFEHISSCVKDFHSKLYPRKRVKTESKEERSSQLMDDSNDDVVEIVMQVDAPPPCEKE